MADDGEIVLWAISEHIEDAGVHSGDATLCFRRRRCYIATIAHRAQEDRRQARRGARDHRPVQHPVPRQARRASRSSSATCARRAASRSCPRSPAPTSSREAMRRMLGVREPVENARARPRLRGGEGAAVLFPAARRAPIRCSASRWRAPERWAASATTATRRCCRRSPRRGSARRRRGVLLSLGPMSEKYSLPRGGSRAVAGARPRAVRDARHRRDAPGGRYRLRGSGQGPRRRAERHGRHR